MSFLDFLFRPREQRQDIGADEVVPSSDVASSVEPVVTPGQIEPKAEPVSSGPVITPEEPVATPVTQPGTPVVGGEENR